MNPIRVTLEDGTTQAVQSIYCIGRNYAKHAAELGNELSAEPVVFLKSLPALRPLASGPLAFANESFHHEAELVLLIGKELPLGGQGDWSYIKAISLGLDLTRREVQNQLKKQGLPWTTAKSFAGAALVGEFIPVSALENPDRLRFTLDVEGELRQQGDSALMLFPMVAILTYLASLQPLRPGDLIYTGTPEGVGPIKKGDEFVLTLETPPRRFTGKL